MNQLPRTLGIKDAFMLVVGNMVGVGIFTTTGYIAQYTPTPIFLIGLWLFGGLLVFCGGLTYAELSTRFPLAGGDLHYLSEAYHPLLGFLFGWAAFVVMYTGSISVIAVGFSHYLLNLFPVSIRSVRVLIPLLGLELNFLKFIAVFIIFLFTYLNTKGIRSGTRWQNIFTISGIVVLILFILLGISSKMGNWRNLYNFIPVDLNLGTIAGIGVALVGIFFTYSGWTVIAYIAGEVREPIKTIPKSMLFGVITVTFLYALIQIVYLLALPLSQMSGIIDIGYQALIKLRGEGLSIFFLIMILLAILSTLNATILSGARIYYAMAQKGRFFKWARDTHPKHQSPARALWLQLAWTVVLILSGSFNQLLTYTVFIMVFFGCFSGIGLFILRRKLEMSPTVYLAWGFPVTPLIYILTTAFILFNTLWKQPIESLWGILLVLGGIPFYFYFKYQNQKSSS